MAAAVAAQADRSQSINNAQGSDATIADASSTAESARVAIDPVVLPARRPAPRVSRSRRPGSGTAHPGVPYVPSPSSMVSRDCPYYVVFDNNRRRWLRDGVIGRASTRMLRTCAYVEEPAGLFYRAERRPGTTVPQSDHPFASGYNKWSSSARAGRSGSPRAKGTRGGPATLVSRELRPGWVQHPHRAAPIFMQPSLPTRMINDATIRVPTTA